MYKMNRYNVNSHSITNYYFFTSRATMKSFLNNEIYIIHEWRILYTNIWYSATFLIFLFLPGRYIKFLCLLLNNKDRRILQWVFIFSAGTTIEDSVIFPRNQACSLAWTTWSHNDFNLKMATFQYFLFMFPSVARIVSWKWVFQQYESFCCNHYRTF